MAAETPADLHNAATDLFGAGTTLTPVGTTGEMAKVMQKDGSTFMVFVAYLRSLKATAKVSERAKRSVVCPACGAAKGKPCKGSRIPSASTLGGGWGGPPALDRAHEARRLAFLFVQASVMPVTGHTVTVTHPGDHVLVVGAKATVLATLQTPDGPYARLDVYGAIAHAPLACLRVVA